MIAIQILMSKGRSIVIPRGHETRLRDALGRESCYQSVQLLLQDPRGLNDFIIKGALFMLCALQRVIEKMFKFNDLEATNRKQHGD